MVFTINGERWDVVYVPFYHYKLEKSDGQFSVGACDDIDKRIYLSEELQGRFLKKVLCHEITHAAMFSYNVDLTYDEEELVADLIATYGEEVVDITDSIFKRIKEGY